MGWQQITTWYSQLRCVAIRVAASSGTAHIAAQNQSNIGRKRAGPHSRLRTSLCLPRSGAPPTGPLRPEFLWPHLGFIIASYVCFTLAFAMAVFYFIGEHSLKAHHPVSFLRLLPPLAIADRSADRLVAIGLPLLTLGILMGVILANQHAKPLFTLNDLKLPLAVLTWLFFASYLIARHVTSCSRKLASLLIVIGFIILLITFLGAPHTIAGA